MTYFRKPDFKEVLDVFWPSANEVITECIIRGGISLGPSFIVEGDVGEIEPKQLIGRVADKTRCYGEKLSVMNAYVVESLCRMPEEVKSWKVEKGNSVLSFRNTYYSSEEIGLEQMIAIPFSADGVPGKYPRNVDVVYWDPWSNGIAWQLNYDLAHDNVPEDMPRMERFQVEDVFSYVNKLGGISLQKNMVGELLLDAQYDIIAESREVGARDGYYENEKSLDNMPWQPDLIDGIHEVLRKELHLVLPTQRILYYTNPESSGKPTAIVRVFKYDENHLAAVFQFCPNLVKLQTSTDSSVSKVERKPFWKKLFKV